MASVKAIRAGSGVRFAAYLHAESEAVARLKPETDPLLADKLGLDLAQNLKPDQVANLLNGLRADGERIEGKRRPAVRIEEGRKVTKQCASIHFAPGPHKSVSVAAFKMANPREREAILDAHRKAINTAMREVVEPAVGFVRRGAGGRKHEAASVTWIAVEHYQARPTHRGEQPDPHIHTHICLLNTAMSPSGFVGTMKTNGLRNGVLIRATKVYNRELARELNANGIPTAVDKRTGIARVLAVPEQLCLDFSKRRKQIQEGARKIAADEGKRWDDLHDHVKQVFRNTASWKSRRRKPESVSIAPTISVEKAAVLALQKSIELAKQTAARSLERTRDRAALIHRGHEVRLLKRAFEAPRQIDAWAKVERLGQTLRREIPRDLLGERQSA